MVSSQGKMPFRCYTVVLLFLLAIRSVNAYPQDDTVIAGYMENATQAERAGNSNRAVYYYNKAAQSYWQKNELKSAISAFRKALANARTLGNENAIKVIHTNLGLLYSDLQEHDRALENFTEALKAAERLGREVEIARSLLNVATEQLAKGQNSVAIATLSRAERIGRELGDSKILKNTYYYLNKAYEKQGNSAKATEYFSLYAMLTKKLQAQEIRRKEQEAQAVADSARSVAMQIAREKEQTDLRLKQAHRELVQTDSSLKAVEQITREQQMRIDLLNTEMKLRELELQRQHLLQRVYLGLIFVSLAFIALISWAYREKKKANRQLMAKNSEITRQKEELASQAHQLRELNALKDKLFSIIAHDLRSPLFSLISMLNIAKQEQFSEENFRSILGELSSNVNHTTALLENLLTWAKNQMHGARINPVSFQINEVVNARIEALEELARQKGVDIVNRIDSGVTVYADRDMLDIVLRNLVTNAIKFSHRGGNITISNSYSGDNLVVCVEDQGVGIEPENLKKIFGNQIISTPGTNNEKGTGLGLVLCKDFITMNNGSIWVESEPGSGSRFFFTLPLSR